MTLPTNLKSDIERLTGILIIREKMLVRSYETQFFLVQTASSNQYFLKYRPSASNNFHREAEGLTCIQSSNSCNTPKVIASTPNYILMEYIDAKKPDWDYWPQFGRLLAKMHLCTAPEFGFKTDNYCGPTPQPNPQFEDGHQFFSQNRLLYQAKLAREQSLLTIKDVQALTQICVRLKELIPPQPPVLLHGDLCMETISVTSVTFPF